jgi:hypothetical protein
MANVTNVDKWFPRCRLAWIERKAKKQGWIQRSEITEMFGNSNAQASADLQAYHDLNPAALQYDMKDKCYYWTEGSELVVLPAPWEDLKL